MIHFSCFSVKSIDSCELLLVCVFFLSIKSKIKRRVGSVISKLGSIVLVLFVFIQVYSDYVCIT